jgi:predicted RNA-binding Zn ribbon-like protein
MSNNSAAVAPLRLGSDRKPPPGDLKLVQGFVNTLDLESLREDIPDAPALGAWLAEYGLMSASDPVSDADFALAISVREALRKLLYGNNGHPLDPGAMSVLNSASKSAEMMVRFGDDGRAEFSPVRTGVDGALARLFDIVATAQCEGTWVRMKACPADKCGWAFYDASKNRSATWCSMDSCGNRAKAQAYRERHRAHAH